MTLLTEKERRANKRVTFNVDDRFARDVEQAHVTDDMTTTTHQLWFHAGCHAAVEEAPMIVHEVVW